MAVSIKNTIARTMILGTYAPYFCLRFKILPDLIRYLMLPPEEVDAVTLTNTV